MSKELNVQVRLFFILSLKEWKITEQVHIDAAMKN